MQSSAACCAGPPERIYCEDDVGAYAGGRGGLDRRGRVGAPGMRDDGAVRAHASLRATFSRSLRIGFASGKSLANEDARQGGARVEFYQGAGDAYRRRRKTDISAGGEIER
jgi:hypothetical protein